MKRCSMPHCRGIITPGARSDKCAKCRTRLFKKNHPLKYAFANLRKRARQRGHVFELTFAEYQKFAVETGYDRLKGKTKYALSIHRKDSTKGYRMDNISAITLSLNSRLEFANIPDYLKSEMIEAEAASRKT